MPSSTVPWGNPSCRDSSGLHAFFCDSLNSSSPLSWWQFCIHGALCSAFQWCFYKMLDKLFLCAFWMLTHKAVTQCAPSSMVYFPELSVSCVTLTTTKADCTALSLIHPTHNQNGVIVLNKPRLGHRCLKAAIQVKCLGLKAKTWLSSVQCGTGNIKQPSSRTFFCLLLCIYICLQDGCKKQQQTF